jgi:hypothetical protein
MMMTTVSVSCPKQGCHGLAFLSKARYEAADEALELRCEHGHAFEYDKRTSPPKRI